MSTETDRSARATTYRTEPAAYLVIARYRRDKWLALDPTEREKADEQAEALFPKTNEGFPHPNGVLRAYTFYTSIHSAIPEGILRMSEDQQDQIVANAFANVGDKAPGTDVKDPRVGFMAVIEADKFSSFTALLDNDNSPLAKIYVIEVIPLNGDKTMNDIYTLMTPVSWSH